MSQQKTNYDAIIIGAGISGLICGCYLAKAGMKVLIVEQHDKPGGYFTSFKRKGFQFDAAAHCFGNYREGGYVRNIIKELGVDSIMTIRRADPSDVVVTPDFEIAFWNDTKKTLEQLIRIFPHEKKGLVDFFNFFQSPDKLNFSKLKDKSFDAFLQSFFKDKKLLSALALPVLGYGGLPPSLMHAFNGAKVFAESIIDGGYYPEGGMQNLPNALEHIIKENGGEILYKRLVKKILVKNNCVAGIKLNNNELLVSKYVVSACDITQTFKTFLEEKVVGKNVHNVLKSMIPSLSIFILYIGIDKPFEGLPPRGTSTWYLPYYDLNEVYDQIQKCNFNKSGMYMIRVSPDHKTILALTNAPFQTMAFWEKEKKKMAEIFLAKIEKLIPNLKKHIVYLDAATPATLYRYTLNYRGAAYGWASTPSQMFIPELRQISFIDGLFLAGHWTSIGAGLPATLYSGFETARRLLRKDKERIIAEQSTVG